MAEPIAALWINNAVLAARVEDRNRRLRQGRDKDHAERLIARAQDRLDGIIQKVIDQGEVSLSERLFLAIHGIEIEPPKVHPPLARRA